MAPPLAVPSFGLDAYGDAKQLLWAWAQTQPRMLAMLMVLPLFNQQLVPSLLRFAIAAAFGLLAAPALPGDAASAGAGMPSLPPLLLLLVLTAKEAFVGFVLGYFFAMPFWLFQAVGFIIDNQRGASIAATLDPLTGNDSSPLGQLFLQAFIVFLLSSGGLQLVLGSVYDSFLLWPPAAWLPRLSPASVPLLLDQLDRLIRLALVLASPVLIVMFLAEMGLALISRFVPQLQVFFIAMPIKSALAFLVLTMYVGTLFARTGDILGELHTVLPFLNEQWQARPP
ncbi:type III secretion system export apparatus subunit SctT [Robbsia sp. Bb-Pol-6]|uniref:Type III secretion system export apparatus subunit SctT n=1 Tax=Robbsia betulipollinis TaxID=2981849 RepID=A0ABT3ZMV6_9BURK|nr:type III secretion system export apparatus subunit SctT [Robbsia betulipollinis]MCY0387288.1 type III secretion system export apparatus subunit SctT [Robbsia betulipollinis]